MHPFSILTLGIFVAGYITARWDLVTRLYELAIFAWDYGVVVSLESHPLPPSRPSSSRQDTSLMYSLNIAGTRHQRVCNPHHSFPTRFHPRRTSCDKRSQSGMLEIRSSSYMPRITADAEAPSTPGRQDLAYRQGNNSGEEAHSRQNILAQSYLTCPSMMG